MKFKEGDKVRVVDVSKHDASEAIGMLGHICEIRGVDGFYTNGYNYQVWQPDKKDYWYFKESELELAEPKRSRGRPRKEHKMPEIEKLREDFENFKAEIQDQILQLAFEVSGVKKDEPKTWQFTDDEKVILRNLPENYKWIARDEDRELYVYSDKPNKKTRSWNSSCYDTEEINIYPHLFQSIQWADEEPCEFRKFI